MQELANRMAERAVDVIKELLKLGTMATVNQSIDADTAEIIVESPRPQTKTRVGRGCGRCILVAG